MATARLDQFTITPSGEDYLLRLTVAGGEPFEVVVDYDRLDLVAEAIDAALDRDGDDHDEVAGQAAD